MSSSSINEMDSEKAFDTLSPAERADMANIQKDLGNVALKNNKLEDALIHYNKMLEIDPLSIVGYCNRSITYYKMKNFSNGLEDAIKAVNIDPLNSKALYRRYSGYFYTNRIPEAILDLNKILELDPKNEQVKTDLINAQAILALNQEKEYESLNSNEIKTQNKIDAIPLKLEEEKKEEFSVKFSDISEIIREELKSKDKIVMEEVLKQNEELFKSYKSPTSNDEEENQEKLNQIWLNLNDLQIFLTVNQKPKSEIAEVLNKKKFFLKEMIAFEYKKTHLDHAKIVILINSLLNIYEKDEDDERNQNELEIIKLLKKRSEHYEFLHNNYLAKIGREYAEELEQNRETSDETKNNDEPEEKKQNFVDSKENIIRNVTQLKDNGVDKFRCGLYVEALKFFNQAQKILERDFAEEIRNKTPFVFDIYIKTIRNSALSHHQAKEFQLADEQLDLILTLIPDDDRTLEYKANNYQEMASYNSKIFGLNYETLLKAQEILKKLIAKQTVGNNERDKYQKQLNSIQADILMKDPEYKKNQKIVDDFEKKVVKLKDDTELMIYLKELNFDILEKNYKVKPMGEKYFIFLLNFICSNTQSEDITFKVQILKFLKEAANEKLSFHLNFLDCGEKKNLKQFFETIEKHGSFVDDIKTLKISFKIS